MAILEPSAERICDIMLTYCDEDREFGIKLAGEWWVYRFVWFPMFTVLLALC